MNKIIKLLVFCYFNIAGLIFYSSLTLANDKIPALDSSITISQKTPQVSKLTYDQYMKAGYEASKARQYQEASKNFQEALKLRPRNSYAQKALSNVKTYIYDDFMGRGYQATQKRDYKTALQHFQQAANQRPNDVYAQQAIKNIQQFAQNSPNNLLLILVIFMGIIIMGLGLIMARLFQLKSSATENNILPENQEFTNTNSIIIPKLKEYSGQTNTPNNNFQESNLIALEKTSNIEQLDDVQQLILDLEQNDAKKRRKAIWELAQKGDSRAVKPLVNLMLNANSYEKSLILEALSQISNGTMKSMNQALLISLQDDNSQVRKNALRDLSKAYELINQIQPLVHHAALNDSDSEVREIANWALDKLHTNKNSPQLSTSNEEVNATLISDEAL